MRWTTIKDVAERAGVSISTVSRVLNGKSKDHMRPETEERVLQVIRELDYSPNRYARILKKQRTGVIGCLPQISPISSSPNCSVVWRTSPIVTTTLSLPREGRGNG